jgi:AAA domain
VSDQIDFAGINNAALARGRNFLEALIPGGKFRSLEYIVRNPRRDDRQAGSFSINYRSGVWKDFATGDGGGDLVSLAAYVWDTGQGDAAHKVAGMVGIPSPKSNGGCTNGHEPHAAVTEKPLAASIDRQEQSGAIALSYYSDLKEVPPKLWLIKNVIARGETSGWIGPPGAGKSALLGDLCIHGAGGFDWRGYRIRKQFGALYFALERADLVKRRLVAQRLRDDLPIDLPIAISGQVIDLIDRKCAGDIFDTIKRAEDRFGREIGLVVIDTYAKGIAAGGGNESEAKDQNIAVANLRRVLDKAPNVHIATAGHTGKDVARGERGSNAKLADVDLQVLLSGENRQSCNSREGQRSTVRIAHEFSTRTLRLRPRRRRRPVPHLYRFQRNHARHRAKRRQTERQARARHRGSSRSHPKPRRRSKDRWSGR